jgi:hypothetical protein
MRAISRRLTKLEHKFGMVHGDRLLMIATTSAKSLALDNDTCVRILDEAGFLHTTGMGLVKLMDIPTGLNAEQTEKFLREEGFKICPNGPRSSPRAAAGSE